MCNARCMSEQLTTESGRIPSWTLGDRMAKSLKSAKVTREAMAAYLDVSLGTVSTWTGDRIRPSKQTLRLWALRTGVPLEWLQTGQTHESPHPAGPEGGDVAATND